MQAIFRVRDWLNARRELAYDLIRVYLGLALFIRGALFIADPASMGRLGGIEGTRWLSTMALSHYVAMGHLIGGLLLAAGLLTRFAAVIQAPILFGAVFLVHLPEGLLAATQSLELSGLTLFLLIIYAVWGPGRFSADARLFAAEKKRQEALSQDTGG
jgi:uncharacterized membrane protein YphA (DoxX/SURF4 family)